MNKAVCQAEAEVIMPNLPVFSELPRGHLSGTTPERKKVQIANPVLAKSNCLLIAQPPCPGVAKCQSL